MLAIAGRDEAPRNALIKTYSATACFDGSCDAGRGTGESIITSSEPGVGDWTSICTNGALCGNGDMSIISTCPGDDDGGRGGVVTYSAQLRVSLSTLQHLSNNNYRLFLLPRASNASIMAAVVKRARRGVGNMGLLQDYVCISQTVQTTVQPARVRY